MSNQEKMNNIVPKEKRKILSVTCVTVLIAVSFIMGSVAISLAVTLTFADSAAENFATMHTAAMSLVGRNKAEDFLTMASMKHRGVASGFRSNIFPDLASINDSTARAVEADKIMRMLGMGIIELKFIALYIHYGLEDGSFMICAVSNIGKEEYYCEFYDAQLPCSDSSMKNVTKKYYNNKKQDPRVREETYCSKYDPRNRKWYSDIAKVGASALTIATPMYVEVFNKEVIFDFNGPLILGDGTFAGVLSISITLNSASPFLRAIPGTGKSVIFLLDNDGRMVGSSDVPPVNTIVECINCTKPSNCVEYNETFMLCMQMPNESPTALIRNLARSRPDLLKGTSEKPEKVKLDDGTYYIAVCPITVPYVRKGMDWLMVTAVPKGDLTGKIDRGRNVALAILSVVVIVAAVVCTICLYLFLRPLHRVAARMREASTMKATLEEPPVDSRLREISDIAEAFEDMYRQLLKARSFLPESLLAQLDGDESEGDERVPYEQSESINNDRVTAFSFTGSSHTGDIGNNLSRKTSEDIAFVISLPRNFSRHSSSLVNSSRNGTIISSLPTLTIQSKVSSKRSHTDSMNKATECDVNSRMISVVAFNIRGFHAQVLAAAVLGNPYAALVDMVSAVAKQHRGIVDSFHGDRFFLTFNAVKNCSSHAVAALKAARALEAAVCVPVSIGVATGAAQVGNMGSDRTKRFCSIGSVFPQATILERLCKMIPLATIATTRSVAIEAAHVCQFLFVDVVALPGKSANTPVTVCSVKRDNENGDAFEDEWMYEIQRPSGGKLQYANAAFEAALDGDDLEAEKKLKGLTDSDVNDSESSNPVSEPALPDDISYAVATIKKILSVGPSYANADLGRYYQECMLSNNTSAHSPLFSSFLNVKLLNA